MYRSNESTLECPATNPSPERTRASRGSVALDQWRGLALILVLVSHGFFFTGRVAGIGRIGVNLFFFISGLLTFRSLNGGSGTLSQRTVHFIKRRLWRLYPALIAYLGVMLFATLLLQHLPNLPSQSDFKSYVSELPFAVTYTANYAYAHHWVPSLEQLWSVSCEMQFYVLAPVIFALGIGSRRRGILVFGSVCLLLVLSGAIYPMRAASYEPVKYHFQVAAWPMMFGFFCEFRKDWFLRIPRRAIKYAFVIGVVAILASLIIMPFSMHVKKVVIAVGALGLFPCLFGYLFDLPFPGRTGRCLAWLGERTYSIYLWQQSLTICDYLPALLHPFGAAASIILGALWFDVCEKPFLSRRRVRQLVVLESSLASADHQSQPTMTLTVK
jgi:peptidoglycan/LPS O-acetylase OafA/YrhL